MNNKPKTIICDIDGVLLEHRNQGLSSQLNSAPLRGTIEKINEWDAKGYNIILITGRRESLRNKTEQQLLMYDIFYDQLIMGFGGSDRVLVNDRKSDGRTTAFAVNIDRNVGLKETDYRGEENV